MSEYERLAHYVKRLRPPFEGLKRRRDILCSHNFHPSDVKAERARRCLSLANLQHADGATDIGQDRQVS